MAIVYQHIRLDNNTVFYIGIGKNKSRAYNKHFKNRNVIWVRTVKKYGFRVEILKENMSWEEACQEEIKLIKKYGRLNIKTGILVNLTDGGEGNHNRIISKKTKNKISMSLKNHIVTKETRVKIKISCGKSVYQYTKDMIFVKEFSSLKEASVATNINHGHISCTCIGRRKSAGGFVWKFKNQL